MFNAAASESNGEWYLGVYCRKCQAPIPVFQDPGRGTAITAGSGKLTVACPRCGKKAHYAAREVITFLVYADRPATADRAPVNDDQPIDSGTRMADSEPVLDLAPYEIPDAEPEDEFVPDAISEAEPAPELGQGRPRGPEIVLELAPYEISEGEEAAAPAPEPVAEAAADQPELREETTVGELPAPDADPEVERDVPEVVAEQSPQPEPTPIAAPSVEPAGQPDRDGALELEAFFDTSPLAEPGLAEVAPEAPASEGAATEEPPGHDMPLAALVPEAAEATPVPVAEPVASSDPGPVPSSQVDAALDLEAFFEASPLPEAAPVDAPAPEPEPAASSDREPVPPSQIDAGLDLEAFFEATPLPEAAPVEAPAPEPEPAASSDREPVPPSQIDAGLDLEAFFEATPLPEAAPVEAPAPEPEPAPAIELEAAPETDVEPIRQPTPEPALELEAFFEASPPAEPAPLAEAQTEVPAASEAFAREALISSGPTFEISAAETPPAIPAAVEMVPAEPPPPAAPKPIAVIYRERWADAAARPQIIKELRPLIQGLKARAEAQRHDVLVRVTDLFMDYLVEVAPERQSGVAIEQYIHAVFALSTRGRLRGTDRIGEEMAATLRALNRHAGLYTHR